MTMTDSSAAKINNGVNVDAPADSTVAPRRIREVVAATQPLTGRAQYIG